MQDALCNSAEENKPIIWCLQAVGLAFMLGSQQECRLFHFILFWMSSFNCST